MRRRSAVTVQALGRISLNSVLRRHPPPAIPVSTSKRRIAVSTERRSSSTHRARRPVTSAAISVEPAPEKRVEHDRAWLSCALDRVGHERDRLIGRIGCELVPFGAADPGIRPDIGALPPVPAALVVSGSARPPRCRVRSARVAIGRSSPDRSWPSATQLGSAAPSRAPSPLRELRQMAPAHADEVKRAPPRRGRDSIAEQAGDAPQAHFPQRSAGP
jgi:hypothetical protein